MCSCKWANPLRNSIITSMTKLSASPCAQSDLVPFGAKVMHMPDGPDFDAGASSIRQHDCGLRVGSLAADPLKKGAGSGVPFQYQHMLRCFRNPRSRIYYFSAYEF